MAAERSASVILLSIIAAAVLFAVLIGICHIGFLSRRGYDIQAGWQTPGASPVGECDRALVHTGFPLTSQRPANDPSGCRDETNPLTQAINIALCFAVASVGAVGVANVIHNRYG